MSFAWSWCAPHIGYVAYKYLITFISLLILLAGCSGGGGGGGGGNTAPAITAGCSTTSQGNPNNPSPFMGMLVASDVETPNAISYSLDVNNPMDAGPVMTTNGGMVALNTVTGEYTYTPPAQGQGLRGRDTFQFRVDDPDTFSVATETIIVKPKIMPLGDSITDGWSSGQELMDDGVAYRLELFNDLAAAGFDIDYVGELTSGMNLLPAGQTSHAGYGGCRDQDIANGTLTDCGGGSFPPGSLTGIFDELQQNPADIVLMHIGTNPINNFNTDPGDVEQILNRINDWENSANGNPVSIVVMEIINRNPSPLNDEVAVYNQMVIDRISMRLTNDPMPLNTLPDQIIYGGNANVDMYTALGGNMPIPLMMPGTLYFDGLHPNNDGYTIIEDILFNVLTGANSPAILQSCP